MGVNMVQYCDVCEHDQQLVLNSPAQPKREEAQASPASSVSLALVSLPEMAYVE
jgi:hypothetical protein